MNVRLLCVDGLLSLLVIQTPLLAMQQRCKTVGKALAIVGTVASTAYAGYKLHESVRAFLQERDTDARQHLADTLKEIASRNETASDYVHTRFVHVYQALNTERCYFVSTVIEPINSAPFVILDRYVPAPPSSHTAYHQISSELIHIPNISRVWTAIDHILDTYTMSNWKFVQTLVPGTLTVFDKSEQAINQIILHYEATVAHG